MISDYLSREERLACMKAGALLYANSRSGSVKSAQVASAAAGVHNGLKAVDSAALLVATLLGIPIGLGVHALSRTANDKRFEEEKINKKIDLYNEYANDIRSGARS